YADPTSAGVAGSFNTVGDYATPYTDPNCQSNGSACSRYYLQSRVLRKDVAYRWDLATSPPTLLSTTAGAQTRNDGSAGDCFSFEDNLTNISAKYCLAGPVFQAVSPSAFTADDFATCGPKRPVQLGSNGLTACGANNVPTIRALLGPALANPSALTAD